MKILLPRLIQIHRYTLTPRSAPNSRSLATPRQGCLLRADFPGIGLGYADCFPWPELGDAPLEAQLESLNTGHLTPITERSIFFAHQDAQARRKGVSLFEGLTIPPSHLLVTQLESLKEAELIAAAKAGFQLIKAKVGKSPDQEIRIIKNLDPLVKTLGLKWRLDFNSSLNLESMHTFLNGLNQAVDRIDFLEDPIPFDLQTWENLSKTWKVRLALDRIEPQELPRIEQAQVDVLVIKPASQNPEQICALAQKIGASVVFTSSMDHPLGQICAAWSAAQAAQRGTVLVETAGLLSQHAYESHPWSEAIRCTGPKFIAPKEPGFGLGETFEALAHGTKIQILNNSSQTKP